ncbi:hypothetical protein SAMN06295967_10565 [Belliella buryatensis]|uniref:Uncharacterized protein n=1 Tax=Belliella buryatensis TaxID=1500549 RepID=A0A239CIB0_9BACT|nr:hypothetical protein SAMN06295967_10565 [Belliella buryatensis]
MKLTDVKFVNLLVSNQTVTYFLIPDNQSTIKDYYIFNPLVHNFLPLIKIYFTYC